MSDAIQTLEGQPPAQAAPTAAGGRDHMVNLRVSVPSFSGRYYVNLLIGKELRDPTRRAEESRAHPVGTSRNKVFLFVIGAIFGLGALLLVLDGALFMLEMMGLN